MDTLRNVLLDIFALPVSGKIKRLNPPMIIADSELYVPNLHRQRMICQDIWVQQCIIFFGNFDIRILPENSFPFMRLARRGG
jgi:hypothetical protein